MTRHRRERNPLDDVEAGAANAADDETAFTNCRPLLGIAILVLALAGIVGAVTMMARAKKKARAA